MAHGDLLEYRDIAADEEQQAGTLLYAAPPSFVRRQSGAVLILGVAPDSLSPLPEELRTRIEYVNHVRRLPATAEEQLGSLLRELGFVELSYEAWAKAPAAETAAQHLVRLGKLLDGAPASIDIPGLSILDPTKSVRYYKERWDEPKTQTGRFVGRRSQAYGAPLWCYVELQNGQHRRFLDLPLPGSRARGCDDAWRLQAAVDAQRGAPECFRLRQGPDSSMVIDFFSPTPMWARRRWDWVGEPTVSAGPLFSYRFANSEVEEELSFIRDSLWLAELSEVGRQ